MNGAFARYFCSVTAPGDKYGDLGFDYYEAIKGSGFPTRVLPVGGSDIGAGRWAEYSDAFVREVPRHYLNVVCGPIDILTRVFTIGVPNVAIVTYEDAEPGGILDYDLVICPTFQGAQQLAEHGVSAIWAKPEHDVVGPLLRELI